MRRNPQAGGSHLPGLSPSAVALDARDSPPSRPARSVSTAEHDPDGGSRLGEPGSHPGRHPGLPRLAACASGPPAALGTSAHLLTAMRGGRVSSRARGSRVCAVKLAHCFKLRCWLTAEF